MSRMARPTTSRSSASRITRRRRRSGIACSTWAFDCPPAPARMRWRTTRRCAVPSVSIASFSTRRAPVRPPALRDALKGGRDFVSNGPLLGLIAGDERPGGTLRLDAGGETAVRVALRSPVAVDHLELVANGRVIRTFELKGERHDFDWSGNVPLTASGWLLLRAWNEHADPGVLDIYPYATTSPIYLESPAPAPAAGDDARYFVTWLDRVIDAASKRDDYNTADERADTLRYLREARQRYVDLGEAARKPQDQVSNEETLHRGVAARLTACGHGRVRRRRTLRARRPRPSRRCRGAGPVARWRVRRVQRHDGEHQGRRAANGPLASALGWQRTTAVDADAGRERMAAILQPRRALARVPRRPRRRRCHDAGLGAVDHGRRGSQAHRLRGRRHRFRLVTRQPASRRGAPATRSGRPAPRNRRIRRRSSSIVITSRKTSRTT